jgi:nucleoside-diphosphate-sugar epimerase
MGVEHQEPGNGPAVQLALEDSLILQPGRDVFGFGDQGARGWRACLARFQRSLKLRLLAHLRLPVLVRIAADALLVNLAFSTALFIRFLYFLLAYGVSQGSEDSQRVFDGYLLDYLTNAGLLTGTCLVTFALSGFYTHGRAYRGRYKILIVTQAVTLSYVLFGFLRSFGGEALNLSRGALVLAWVLTLGLLIAARLRGFLWRYGARLDRCLARADPDCRPRSILVIGGGGYIGSALLPKLLSQGYRVRLLDRLLYGVEPILGLLNHPRLEIHRADFRQVDKVVAAMQDMDAVVHLGAIVGDPACALDESLTIEINLTATRMIAEVAKGCGVRHFVFASTCSVYGASEEILDERSALNPVSLYARSKIACERILLKMAGQNFAPVILRFGTIYGLSGRIRFDLVVNLLAAKAKLDGIITVHGGDQWRPFLHVDDAAQAILSVLQAPTSMLRNPVFNVGSGEQNYTIAQMAEIIHQMVPTARLVTMDSEGDRRNYRVSFQKIRQAFGFRPHWTIAQGVQQVLEAIANGDVEDYQDPKYSNAQFLKKEGPARLVRHDDGWARELLDELVSDPTNASGRAGARPGPHFAHATGSAHREGGNGHG